MARKLVLGIIFAVLAGAPALAECPGATPWLWSASSDVVNRSTQALAAGRMDQARGLAETALDHRLSAADQRIAAHNLCLVRVTGGSAAEADAQCRAAREGADRTAPLCGETLSKARKVTGPDVSAAIAANIAAAGSRGTVAQRSAATQ